MHSWHLSAPRCTLHPSDSLAMEGPLSRAKSLKKSLRQSFRRIRKSRVSGAKRAANANSKVRWAGRRTLPPVAGPGPQPPGGRGWDVGWQAVWQKMVSRSPTALQLQEANAQLAGQACPHDVEMTPVQRRIEPRSADDSLSGVVRCLYFADTFLRDGEARGGAGGHLGNGQWWGRGGTASSRGWKALRGWRQGASATQTVPWNFWGRGVEE